MAVMSACDGVEEEERHHDEEGAEVGGAQQLGGRVADALLAQARGRGLHLLQLPLQLLPGLCGLLSVPAQTLECWLRVYYLLYLFV